MKKNYLLAHKLHRDVGSFASSEAFLSRPQRPFFFQTDNMLVSYINHQGNLRSRSLYKLAHKILLWSLAEGNLPPGVSECGSRRSVEIGAEALGMETLSRIGGAHLEKVWLSRGHKTLHI